MRLRVLAMVSVILLLLLPAVAAQIATHVPLPADLQGQLDGVPYRIRVPENWNGTLLVYAHGYNEGTTPPALTPPAPGADPLVIENTLLSHGYALAASRFAGAGFNIKEGIQNTIALTAAFNDMVGRPQRAIIWGRSMGGLMTLGMIEKFAPHYDGAVALCPPAAGAPRRWDQALDVALAYKAAFGWDPAWGTPGNLRDDLNFMTEVLPHLMARAVPTQKGGWEFIRRVNQMPVLTSLPDSYYVSTNRLMPVFFAIGVRAEVEARAGGPVAQNIGRSYSLSDADRAALVGLKLDGVALDAAAIEAMLGRMNETLDITASRSARNYVEHWVNPSGAITRPVLTMHTTADVLATPTHEGAYRDSVVNQGRGDLLMQVFTLGDGSTNPNAHCTFSSDQVVAAIAAMTYWLDTHNRPDPGYFFPASQGFDPAYVISSWPW